MKKYILTALVAIGSLFAAQPTNKNIEGNWKSVMAEDFHNGTFGTRVFDLKKDKWSILFTLYGDKDMKYPVFNFSAEGKYSVDEDYAKIKGANKAQFKFSKKEVTLLTDNAELAAQIGMGSLKKGVKTDISKTGISFLKSVKDAPEEFDVVKVDKGMLYLGARPADGDMGSEEKRPVWLNYPLRKFEPKEEGIAVTNPPKTIYAIINVTIKDQKKFMEYVMGHLPTIDQYGGKIIFESTESKAYEGAVTGNFFLIQEWPSEEDFNKWWDSPEYKPWKEMRSQGADVNLVLSKSRF